MTKKHPATFTQHFINNESILMRVRMVNQLFILLFVIGSLFINSNRLPAEENAVNNVREGKLFWNNGDSLAGFIVSANSKQIVWKSAFFVEPLQIRHDVLSTIRYEAAEPSEHPAGTFRIVMLNGDVLFGQLQSVDEKSLVIVSARHGHVTLKQDKVRTLRRINSKSSAFLGPQGLEGWSNNEEKIPTPAANNIFLGFGGGQAAQKKTTSALPPWRELSDGRISTSKNVGLFHPFDYPDRCEIEVVLESSKLPAFSLMFGKDKNSSLRLESWEDALVALSGYDFVELVTMKKEQRKVHLHFFLDKQKRELAIYSHSGKKLGLVKGTPSGKEPDGFAVQNEGNDLTLSYLRVDRWNGDFPQPLRTGESRVQLTDGSIQYGKLLKIDPNAKTIQFGTADTPTSIQIDKISSITLREGQENESFDKKLQITWRDGGRVSGELHQIAESRVEVQTSYSTVPIHSSLADVHKIILAQVSTNKTDQVKETQKKKETISTSSLLGLKDKTETTDDTSKKETRSETPDKVFFIGGTLRGQLIIENESSSPIKWKPVGGLNASELNSQGEAKFVRGKRHPDLMFDVAAFPDVLFLKNNDVLPCKIIHLSKEEIEVAFPMADAKHVPFDQIKAIEFASSQRSSVKDFADKKWTMTGTVKHSPKEVLMTSTSTLAHPDILTGDDVQFQLDWGANQYARMTIYLNTDNVLNARQDKSETATSIDINTNGESLWVTKGTSPQQRNQFWGMQQGSKNRIIRCKGSGARIRLLTRDGAIHVSVNGEDAFSIPLNINGAQEKGLFFSATFLGVRNSNRKNKKTGNGIERGYRISEFEVNSVAGSAVKQFIIEESRQRALTIPRFRRDDPSTHVIIAPNGDLLRGRLLGIDDQYVSFESKLEVFRFERDRVASIIWLPKLKKETEKKEGKEKELAASKKQDKKQTEKSSKDIKQDSSEIQLRLSHGFSMSFTPSIAKADKLMGQSKILGKCAIPSGSIKELILGKIHSNSYDIFSQWIPQAAEEPKWDIPPEGGADHQLLGTTAADFELPLLDGTTFKLSDDADKVIVLDFWATWCGPCVLALPGYIDATSQFDAKKVIFVAVNLRESSQKVREFLEREDLAPAVALDADGSIATQFGVSGIPHTVIISPGGTIENIKVGYSPTAAKTMQETITKILDGTWKRKESTPKEKPADEPAL